MDTFYMLNKAADVPRFVSTLVTLPGVGQLVSHCVGGEDGLAGELLFTELAWVGDGSVVK